MNNYMNYIMQNITKTNHNTYDNHGLLARTYDDITGEYEPEQLKVVNNTLAITDDNWKTVKAAIGKIHYEDPKHPGDMLSAYGVLGETIIGKLLLGEALGIYNDGGSLKFDKNGLSISNGTNSFVVNPNDETLISLSNNNGKILWVDTKGGLHLRGDGSGLDITSNEAISGVYSAISQLNDEIVLKVDDNGRLATVKLGTDANEGTVVKIGADNINLTAEETINFLSGGEINLSGKNISIKSDNFNVTKDGKMSCQGATIDGDVVANTLTANTKGSIAGFDISSNGLSVSVTETLPTYSNADITRLQQIIVGLVTPTQADYNRLDMNYDGRLTTLDIAAIQRLLNGTDSYTQTSTFLLNPKSIKRTIEISNGNNKTTIGAKSIASPSVSATAVYGNSVATNNLLVGHTNDSTVTGALSTLNSNIGGKQNTLDSPLFYRGTIKGDMNSYNTRSYNGYYYIATTTPPNAPASSGWSIVLVLFAYNDFGIQAIIKPTYNTFLLRERSGSPAQWSAWKKLALNITTN